MELTKPGSAGGCVHSIYCDPGARHAVVVLVDTSGRPTDTVYFHSTWRKARSLQRLRGMFPTACAWVPDTGGDGLRGECVVGTSVGGIWEVQLDANDAKRPDVACRQLLEVPDKEAVRGLHVEPKPGRKLEVCVATANKLFCCTGGPSLDAALGALGPPVVDTSASVTQSGSSARGRCMLHITPQRFAWMSSAVGIVTGPSGSIAQPGEHTTLAFPFPDGAGGSAAVPLWCCATQCHVLLLYADKLLAVNTLSGKPAATLHLSRFGIGGGSSALALTHDVQGGALYLSSTEGLFEVVLKDETRDQWRLHLARREYGPALAAAPDARAKERVHCAAGEAAFAAGDTTAAALAFAKAPSRVRFEDVTLRLLALGDGPALRAYLKARLEALPKSDRAAATLLATWLMELYLHALVAERDAASTPGGPPGGGTTAASTSASPISALSIQFRTFLKAHAAHLDAATAVRLLSDFGRSDELVFFADLRGDTATVVTNHLDKGDAHAAVGVLRRPGTPAELHYSVAPKLFALAPQQAVDLWLAASDILDPATGQPVIDPARLVPALAAARGGALGEVARAQAVRYLEHSASLGCSAPGLHNLLLSLHAEGKGPTAEAALLRYLRAAGGARLYDPAFALRVCTQLGAHRAVVELHVTSGAPDLAVDAALRAGDVELAKRVVDTVHGSVDPDDAGGGQGATSGTASGGRKALWLRIAAHVLAEAASGGGDERSAVDMAVQMVEHSDGVLCLEDVLPLCPDTTSIDAFRDAVLAALDAHATTVTSLRRDMADAAAAADALCANVAQLATRHLALPRNAVCSRCGCHVASAPHPPGGAAGLEVPPFYAFPCGHCFCAGNCLVEAASLGLGPTASQRARHAWATLVDGRAGGEGAKQLYENLLCSECPLCGEAAVRTVTLPFVDPASEGALMASWEV